MCPRICVRGLLRVEALFTCQRGPVSLPLGPSVAGFLALGNCRFPGTNGPDSPCLSSARHHFAGRPARLSARPAPALHARAASAPGQDSLRPLEEGPSPAEPLFLKGAALNRPRWGLPGGQILPTPTPTLVSRPGPACQVQPRGTGEGLGFTADFRRVHCLLPLEGGSGVRSREEGQPLM